MKVVIAFALILICAFAISHGALKELVAQQYEDEP